MWMYWLWGCPKPTPPPPEVPAEETSAVPRIFYVRALVAAEEGDEAEVVRACAWVLRLDGDSAWAQLRVADVLRGVDVEGSLAAARRAVELDPGLREAHGALGRSLLAAGQVPEAVGELERGGDVRSLVAAKRLLGEDPSGVLAAWVPRTGGEIVWWAGEVAAGGDRGLQEVALGRVEELLDDPVLGEEAAVVRARLLGSR